MAKKGNCMEKGGGGHIDLTPVILVFIQYQNPDPTYVKTGSGSHHSIWIRIRNPGTTDHNKSLLIRPTIYLNYLEK